MPRETDNRFRREPQTLEAWESWVDHLIVTAQERGEFDNLPGQGKPLKIEDAPFGRGLEVGFGMMKNAGVAPFWIELEKELRAAAEGMEAALARARAFVRARPADTDVPPADPPRRRLWSRLLPYTDPPASVREPASARTIELDRLRRRYQEHAEALQRATRQYNAAIPRDLWWLARPVRPVAEALAAWDRALAESADPPADS